MGKKKCAMCKIKRKHYVNDKFFVVNCKQHFIPIVILKEHRSELTKEETELIFKEIKTLYPKAKIDTKLKDSGEHWYVHLKGIEL